MKHCKSRWPCCYQGKPPSFHVGENPSSLDDYDAPAFRGNLWVTSHSTGMLRGYTGRRFKRVATSQKIIAEQHAWSQPCSIHAYFILGIMRLNTAGQHTSYSIA